MTIALNIKEIENVYAREEENYVKKLYNMFNETWQEVSLGENSISNTVDLHKDGAWNPNGAHISQQLFREVHMQIRQCYMKALKSCQLFYFCFRERVLRFVFCMEDMDTIPAPAAHKLLKRNLGSVLMLTQIISFNINNVEEETKFIFSKEYFQLFSS